MIKFDMIYPPQPNKGTSKMIFVKEGTHFSGRPNLQSRKRPYQNNNYQRSGVVNHNQDMSSGATEVEAIEMQEIKASSNNQ